VRPFDQDEADDFVEEAIRADSPVATEPKREGEVSFIEIVQAMLGPEPSLPRPAP
jgi:hypothetical protein